VILRWWYLLSNLATWAHSLYKSTAGIASIFNLYHRKELVCTVSPFVAHGMCINCSTLHTLLMQCHTRDRETAVGGPSFKRYSSNPIFDVSITALTQLKYPLYPCVHPSKLLITPTCRIRLQLMRPSTASLNITLFPSSSEDSLGTHIITSGPYSDAVSGVATPLVSVTPGKYLLIPSTYNPGVQAAFRLTVYSTNVAVNIQVVPRNTGTS
jgi:hypothetical protein